MRHRATVSALTAASRPFPRRPPGRPGAVGLAAAWLLLALPASLAAQAAAPDTSARVDGPTEDTEAAPLVTDRPDFTESTSSVAPGRVQLESGYTLSRRDGTDAHDVGEVLVRVGVAEPLELRLAPNSYHVADVPRGTVDGWTNPALGAKATLLEPVDAPPLVPSVALLAGTSLPAGHDDVSPDGAEPEAALALGWEAGERLSVGVNLKHVRLLHDGERFGRTTASVAAGVAATDRLGTYLEAYTLRPDAPGAGDVDVLNGGVTLLLGPDAQLDARLGTGIGGGPDVVLGVGLSVRR